MFAHVASVRYARGWLINPYSHEIVNAQPKREILTGRNYVAVGGMKILALHVGQI
jgi:hypothetical protein